MWKYIFKYILLSFVTLVYSLIHIKTNIKHNPQMRSMVREPIAEGFYPGNKRLLEMMLKKLFKDKAKTTSRTVKGMIVPHAGYLYCGNTAAKAYAQIDDDYDSVIILGPDHTGMAQRASISKEDWKTPLGNASVDKSLADDILAESKKIVEDEKAHMYEHSIEVQLPFLQYTQKDLSFVPIVIPHENMSLDIMQEIANSILNAIGDRKVLIIASSDMTHYGRGYNFTPVDHDGLGWMKDKDKDIIDTIKTLDDIQALNKSKSTTVCGSIPIAILLIIMKHKVEDGELIDYSTSYDVSNNKEAIVGYCGMVF